MSSQNLDSLHNAKKQLEKLMNNLTKAERQQLLVYGIEEWMTIKMGDESASDSDEDDYQNDDDNLIDDPVKVLNSIAKEIRQKVPLNEIVSSENKIAFDDTTVVNHLDAFLFNEDDFEELRSQNELKAFYCRDCQSKNIEPIKFVSQSLSREDLYQVFNNFLPTLDDKVVLDVSSRLGAGLYGAYVYTDAEKIIGLEINKELCDLQNNIIRKYKMDKRVEVMNKKINEVPGVLKTADVVMIVNILEDYQTEVEQNIFWTLLKENLKKETYIVSSQSLPSYFMKFNFNINVNDWVKQIKAQEMGGNFFNKESEDSDMTLFCYQVL